MKTKSLKYILYTMLMVLLFIGLEHEALAQLAEVGPINPQNGFPQWYKDTQGRYLQLCLDGDGVNGPCFFDPVDPANPFSIQTGFGAEAFYWAATAIINTGTIRGLLTLGLEAAYAMGAPADGDQIVFGRVRIRVTGLPVSGLYTVVHPFGTQVFNVGIDPASPRDINFIMDIGVAPGIFTGALFSKIGPFLQWTAPDFPYVDTLTGINYLGNQFVPHTVTGSPFGTNFFSITGPAGVVLDTITGSNSLTTDLFTLQGKIATRFGVTVEKASYERDALGNGFVDVVATSITGQQITVSGLTALPVTMVEDPGKGRYYARIPFTGPLAPGVTVTNVTDNPPTAVATLMKDFVQITTATYDLTFKTLTITAASSDLSAAPVLTTPLSPTPLAGGTITIPGVLAPPHEVTVQSAVGGSDTESVTAISLVNNPPVITSAPLLTATVGQLYNYQLVATDANVGDVLTYFLDVAPAGMTIGPATGMIAWTPTDLQVGLQNVTVRIQDLGGLIVTQSFQITVVPGLIINPPVIISAPLLTATTGQPYSYQMVATIPNAGSVLTYALDVLPAGMTIGASTGLIAWTPDNTQVGLQNVTVRVSDLGGLFTTQSFQINVAPAVSSPPVITSTPVLTALAGQPYSYQVAATDPNVGIVLTYFLDVAPAGMTIGASTGLIAWTPTDLQVGLRNVTVRVQDPVALFATQSFQINVSLPAAPVITSTALLAATAGTPYSYQVVANDPNGGTSLAYSLTVAPAGMTIGAATGLVAWTPTNLQLGLQNATVQVQNLAGLVATQSFQINVAPAPSAPVITSTAILTATAGTPYNYQVVANDPNGGASLVYSLTVAPTGMTIAAANGLISWTPTNLQAGLQSVTVQVQNLAGLLATQSFQVNVAPAVVNSPPVITSAPVLTAAVGQPYSYQVVANDPNAGTVLTYSLGAAPAGMTINAVTGLISWAPTNLQVGVNGVTVRVQDPEALFATQTFNVTVSAGEVIRVTRAQLVSRGGQFMVQGTDTVPGNTLTIHLGTAAGPVVGTATVLARSPWQYRARGLVVPAGVTTVTVVSNTGASITAPLVVK